VKVWTIANQKGGVGKTTTAVTLGGLLTKWGLRTLLIDIDPHSSMTSYFKYDPDVIEDGVYNLFKAAIERRELDPASLIYATGTKGLSLIPATMSLAALDRQASRLDGMGLVIKSSLQKLEGNYDYVVIDCPPILGVLMINALAACERLIIPVQTEFLALKGLERMLHTLRMVLKSRRISLPFTIVPTMYDVRTRASKDSLKVLRETYREHLWNSLIPVDTRLREASRAGIPPPMFDPQSRGVAAYMRLMNDILHGAETTPTGMAI
jgi:chromosome partitioning protein